MAKTIGTSDLLDVWASSGNKVEPVLEKIEQGWALGEQPPHEFMNWLQATFGEKLNHILANGIPTWNAATDYEAGAVVNYAGSVWQATVGSTDSEPATENEDWAALIAAGGEVEIPASDIAYDNTDSGLTAADVQDAIDELADEKLDATGGTATDVTVEGLTSEGPITETPVVANTGTDYIPDLANGTLFHLTLTDNWAPASFPTATAGRQFTLRLLQDGTGGRTVTFPAAVRKGTNATAYSLTGTANRADYLTFIADSGVWVMLVGETNINLS